MCFRGARPLLQGVPSSKTVHRTVLKRAACCSLVHVPCGAHDVGGFRSLRRATRAPPSTARYTQDSVAFFYEKKLDQKTCLLSGFESLHRTLNFVLSEQTNNKIMPRSNLICFGAKLLYQHRIYGLLFLHYYQLLMNLSSSLFQLYSFLISSPTFSEGCSAWSFLIALK